MIGRDSDNDAFAHHAAGEFGFEEVGDFATALADQARDDDVGFRACDHLPHQHRFTDARACDDSDALTAPGSEQGVDRAHAQIEGFGDAPPVEHIAAHAIERPDAACDDRTFAVERLAHCVDDATDQAFPDLHHVCGAVRFYPCAIFDWCVGVERHQQGAVAAKADDFRACGRAIAGCHARTGTDGATEASDF